MSDRTERLERAGDYVLGLMDEAARKEMEIAIRVDPLLRQAVDDLAAHMSVLDLATMPEPLPAGLWGRIEAEIASAEQIATDAAVVALHPPRRRSVKTWPALAMAASVLLALGIGYLGGLLTARQPPPVVLVVLETPDARPGAIFEAYADNSVRVVPLQDFVVPDGQILQVWTLYDQAVGPVSLGTMSRAEVATLAASPLPQPEAEQLYEITLEPAPGSPTGRPTGPILVKGFAKRPPG